MEKKIDITSTAIEKGIDSAKGFLDKLVIPSLEETGLLLKDQVTMWRFKNQVKMLIKAKAICEKYKINPKTISLKLVAPILEYSGLEEDDNLHDRWAILLSNMVDSEQNIENHVFPYILSQLSSNEFLLLEKVYNTKQARVAELTQELNDFINAKPEIENRLNLQIEELDEVMRIKGEGTPDYLRSFFKKHKIKAEISELVKKEDLIKKSINEPEVLPYDGLKDFELSNIMRLGLVKEVKEVYSNPQTLKIPDDPSDYVRFKVNLDSNIVNILTELGELFIVACKEKQ